MNLLPQILLGLGLAIGPNAAFAGGVLYCNPWGCRSSPYFRPPVVAVAPPVVYENPGHPPVVAVPYPIYPQAGPPDPLPQAYRDPPRRRRQTEAEPPVSTPEQKEIEGQILEFCDSHREEAFCGKLGNYLKEHPR